LIAQTRSGRCFATNIEEGETWTAAAAKPTGHANEPKRRWRGGAAVAVAVEVDMATPSP
jgi:hypothetical protein